MAAALVTGCGLVALAGRAAITTVPLDVALALRPNAYLIPDHAIVLYLLIPLASVAGCAFLFAPGLLVALAFGRRGEDFGAWVLKGLAFGLPLVTLWAALVQAVVGSVVLDGTAFLAGIAVLNVAALALVWRRDRAGAVDWARFAGRAPDVAAMTLAPLIVLLLLTPKFYWENFNGDGGHALQAARLIIHRLLPIWPEGAGAVAGYPSFKDFLPSLPVSWLVRLYGESEYAVRLSLLPGLAVAAAGLLALIRHGRASASGWAALGVAATLVCFAWCLAFNASYDPYFADIALPLAREPMILVTFLGFALFYLTGERGWMAAFALLAMMTAPGGPVLLAAWLVAAFLTLRPRPWAASLWGAGALVLAAALTSALPPLLAAAGLGSPSTEFGSDAISARLRYITLDDWQRWLFWLLPGAIVPVLALLAWRWQDRVARAFTLMSLGYFLFFYVQAYRILPHHFTPVMLTPLIVLFRLAPVAARPLVGAGATVAGALGAMLLSTPPLRAPHLEASRLGATIRVEGSRYAGFAPRELGAAHALLDAAFPMPFDEAGTRTHYVGSPLQWYFYATHPRGAPADPVYRIASERLPIPRGAEVIAHQRGWALVALDPARYRADRDRGGIPVTISPLYYVSRRAVFGAGDEDDYRHVWSRRTILSWLKRPFGR